jgi:dihydropteroate synthase
LASKDKVFYLKNTLNVNGKIIDLSSPKIMGILNVTDDSFFDGGKYLNENDLTAQAEKLILDGADIIDIGGYSSRPGAKHINEEIETERVLKGIKTIRTISKEIPISVDTFRANVARKAIELGAGIVNDISGGNLDEKMFQTISNYQVSYIMMHMVGTPQNMTQNVSYDNIVLEMVEYFTKKLWELTQFGIKDVIIDVGFGFSKTTLQNYNLLSHLECFKVLNAPLLVGISRKSMIYKSLKTRPEDALNGTSVLNTIALLKGAGILRVHDVKEAKEVIDLINLTKF